MTIERFLSWDTQTRLVDGHTKDPSDIMERLREELNPKRCPNWYRRCHEIQACYV